jgi:uncharacterized membrane protein
VTDRDAAVAALPIDATFPPAAYERVARLLRGGVIAFLLLAGAGLVGQLVLNPYESVSTLLATGPSSGYGSFGIFVGHLASGQPDSLILLGIYVMVGVTIGRVVLATVDLYRGGERTLGALSATVIVLLLVALFVVAPFVR